jgi:hypothetical protein
MKYLLLSLLFLSPLSFAWEMEKSLALESCEMQYWAWENKKEWKWSKENPVLRCATFSYLVFQYETGYGKSKIFKNKNNAHGIMRKGKIITYKTKRESFNHFAILFYNFRHDQKIKRFIYGYWSKGWKMGWSVTHKPEYFSFMKKNYQETYNDLSNIWK